VRLGLGRVRVAGFSLQHGHQVGLLFFNYSVNYFVMLTLVLWQHVVFLCVSRTVFRMSWLWLCVVCCAA